MELETVRNAVKIERSQVLRNLKKKDINEIPGLAKQSDEVYSLLLQSPIRLKDTHSWQLGLW
jgi:hypothetical protein